VPPPILDGEPDWPEILLLSNTAYANASCDAATGRASPSSTASSAPSERALLGKVGYTAPVPPGHPDLNAWLDTRLAPHIGGRNLASQITWQFSQTGIPFSTGPLEEHLAWLRDKLKYRRHAFETRTG
jgi:hypothetical protein